MSESDHNNPICYQTEDVRNWSDTKIAYEILTSALATTLIVKAFIPIVFVIGFVGNAAFLLFLARVKTMRTITNFYLANLAVADLITIFTVTMTRFWQYVDFKQVQSWPFHTNFGCGMFYFTIHFTSLSSIFFITIISFERYFAICHPLRYRTTNKKRRSSYILTILTWIISTVLSFFRALASSKLVYECILWPSGEKYKYYPNTVRQCKPIHPFFREDILEHIVHSVPFIAAVITNTFVNIQVVQRLRRPPPGEHGYQPHQDQQIKRRITWMLLVNSVIFFLCLAPYNFLLVFMKLLNLSQRKQKYYEHVVFVFVMINSSVNPILYGVVSPSYRRAYFKAFGLSKE